MRARLTCWGTRGTCPSPGADTVRYGGNTSCVEVTLVDGSRVVLDAGTGLRQFGKSLSGAAARGAAPANAVAASASPAFDASSEGVHTRRTGKPQVTIVLTHLHSDHINGLAHFSPLLAQTHRVRLACHEANPHMVRTLVSQQLSAPLFPTIGGVADAIDVDVFDDSGTLHVSPTLRVRALLAHHPGAASMLLVEDDQGPLVAFAPDNELASATVDAALEDWRAMLVRQLYQVPVLVHDATYTADELPRYRGWGHSSAAEATDFALQCDAGTLLLTHHHPDRTDDEVDVIVAHCSSHAASRGGTLTVLGAAERMELVIP